MVIMHRLKGKPLLLVVGKGGFLSPSSPGSQCIRLRGEEAQCRCALLAGSWERLNERAEAVHGAMDQVVVVPLGLEVTVTGHPGSTLAMAAAVAGEETGPKGEDSMLENRK
jgi:hypothetical protein